MRSRKLLHILNECRNTIFRHRIVDGCAHAADKSVSLEVGEAMSCLTFDELGVERIVTRAESDVHERTVFLAGCRLKEILRIKIIVQDLCLLLIATSFTK